jgi:hypothetical protein
VNIGKIRKGNADGIPALFVEIDGKTATFVRGQKINFLNQFGIVFLGSDFQEDTSVRVELEPGRMETLSGYTDDPQVVQLYRDFLGATQ